MRSRDISSAAAPLVLVGGFVAGALLQPASYSSVRDTISALAAHHAEHRWVMTLALALLGVCHVVTGAGLRSRPLVVGGVFTFLVAVFALPSSAHVPVASVAFGCLAVWPFFRRMRLAAVVLLLLVFAYLAVPSSVAGLFERIAATAEALWPLIVVRTALAGTPRGPRAAGSRWSR